MGFIKEPLEVDFYVDPRPITKEDEKAISDFIKADKLSRMEKKNHAGKKNTGLKKKTPVSAKK